MTDLAPLIQQHRHARESAIRFSDMGAPDAADRAERSRANIEKQIDAALIERVGVGLRELGDIG